MANATWRSASATSRRLTDGRQVFGAVTWAEADISTLVDRILGAVGRTNTTEVTAFTDGCPGLGTVLTNVGVTKPSVLDWFRVT